MKAKLRTALTGFILIPVLLLTGCSEQSQLSISGLTGTDAAEEVTVWEAIPEGASAAELAGEDSGEDAEGDDALSGDSADVKMDGTESMDAEDGDDHSEDEIDEASSDETGAGEDTAADEVVTEEVDTASMTGSEELIALVSSFMEEWGLSSSNFSVAFTNLTTGETFYYNEDKLWDGCSTYKLPLNMLYYDMEAEGEITADSIIPGTGGYTLAECHHQSLQYSNNELSEAMVDNLGNYVTMKRNMLKYYTQTEDEIDSSYFNHNYYSARMMMDCCSYVYQHSSEYAELLGYLEAAQPDEYFKTYITDVTIAQKYGLRDGYTHTAGIIYADTPFVLSVYSYNAGGSSMIGSLALLFHQYVTGG